MFTCEIVKSLTYMSVFPNSPRRQGSFNNFRGFQNSRSRGRTTSADLHSHSYRCCPSAAPPKTAVLHQRMNPCPAGAMEAAQTLQPAQSSFPPPPEGNARWSSPEHLKTFALVRKNEASFALSFGKRWMG